MAKIDDDTPTAKSENANASVKMCPLVVRCRFNRKTTMIVRMLTMIVMKEKEATGQLPYDPSTKTKPYDPFVSLSSHV